MFEALGVIVVVLGVASLLAQRKMRRFERMIWGRKTRIEGIGSLTGVCDPGEDLDGETFQK